MNERRLAAILVADVVGYSKLIGSDEAGTLAKLQALRANVIEPAIARHAGRLFKAVGDGFLVEFASAVQAVEAARAIQQANLDGDLRLRIGIHVGDVVVQGDDLMGDGVNIAARIEGIADPGGIAISRAVHEQVRDKLDLSFDDRGEVDLKNIARPVRVFVFAGIKQATAANAPLALPDKPSIAVLPFQNMSGDPEQEYFADGVVEDIITGLSRFKSLFVIARNSSFTYKGRAIDVRQVGRELGVRYVLEGSVRKAANRVRVTAQLIDSATGNHLWADKFDGPTEDVFELQDQVTAKVVSAVAPTVDRAQIEATKHSSPRNFDAYDSYLRAIASLYRLTGPASDETLRLVDRAINLDPEFALAHALKAFCYSWRLVNGWSRDREGEIRDAEHHIRLALRHGGDDAAVLAMAGVTLAAVVDQIEDGSALVSRALEMNPNLAVAWAASAWINVFRGRAEEAIEHAMRYMRLCPLDPNIQSVSISVASANLLLGRHAEAATWARRALQASPDFKPALRMATVAEALSGNVEAAQRFLERLREVDPGARISNIPWRAPHHRTQYSALVKEGLRKAGMPE